MSHLHAEDLKFLGDIDNWMTPDFPVLLELVDNEDSNLDAAVALLENELALMPPMMHISWPDLYEDDDNEAIFAELKPMEYFQNLDNDDATSLTNSQQLSSYLDNEGIQQSDSLIVTGETSLYFLEKDYHYPFDRFQDSLAVQHPLGFVMQSAYYPHNQEKYRQIRTIQVALPATYAPHKYCNIVITQQNALGVVCELVNSDILME